MTSDLTREGSGRLHPSWLGVLVVATLMAGCSSLRFQEVPLKLESGSGNAVESVPVAVFEGDERLPEAVAVLREFIANPENRDLAPEAIKMFDSVAGDKGADSEVRAAALHNIGVAYLVSRDYRTATRFFERAARMNPSSPTPALMAQISFSRQVEAEITQAVGYRQALTETVVAALRADFVAKYAESDKALRAAQEVSLKTQATEHAKTLVTMDQKLDQTLNRQVLRSKTTLEEAVKVADAGRPDMARLLALNALNHDPDNFDALTRYVGWLVEEEQKTQSPALSDEFDRAEALLESSSFQVTPNRVPDLLELRGKLQESRKRLADSLDKRQKQGAELRLDGIKKEVERLQGTDPQVLLEDIEKLRDHTRKLADICDSLGEEQVDEGLAKSAEAQRAKAQMCLLVAETCSRAQVLLKRLQSEDKFGTDGTSMTLAMCESIVSSLAVNDYKDVPKAWSLVEKTTVDIGEKAKAVATYRSKEKLKEVKAIVDGKDQVPLIQECQARIKKLDQLVRQAQTAAQGITVPQVANEAQEAIAQLTVAMADQRRVQFIRYQHWVFERIEKTIEQLGGATRFFKLDWNVSEKEAKEAFFQNQLDTVDMALLSPETSTVFQWIVERIKAEMSKEEKIRTEKAMAYGHNKKRLEDF